MTRTLVGGAIVLVIAAAALLSAGCAETAEDRSRRARPAAERYYEYVKTGDLEGAYRHTLAGSYRAQMPTEAFIKFRRQLAASTGALRGVRLIETADVPQTQRVKLTYALDCERFPNDPPQEILGLEREQGEWRIASIDVKMPKPQQAAPQNLPLPGATPPDGAQKAPAQPR